jgi:hypothetical protein
MYCGIVQEYGFHPDLFFRAKKEMPAFFPAKNPVILIIPSNPHIS